MVRTLFNTKAREGSCLLLCLFLAVLIIYQSLYSKNLIQY